MSFFAAFAFVVACCIAASRDKAKFRLAIALPLFTIGFGSIASAQNATSFVNITGISVKRLGNAVVLRVETDGTVRFGGDFRDWIDVDNGFRPKPTTSIRL